MGWSKTSPVTGITHCPETLWHAAQLPFLQGERAVRIILLELAADR